MNITIFPLSCSNEMVKKKFLISVINLPLMFRPYLQYRDNNNSLFHRIGIILTLSDLIIKLMLSNSSVRKLKFGLVNSSSLVGGRFRVKSLSWVNPCLPFIGYCIATRWGDSWMTAIEVKCILVTS